MSRLPTERASPIVEDDAVEAGRAGWRDIRGTIGCGRDRRILRIGYFGVRRRRRDEYAMLRKSIHEVLGRNSVWITEGDVELNMLLRGLPSALPAKWNGTPITTTPTKLFSYFICWVRYLPTGT